MTKPFNLRTTELPSSKSTTTSVQARSTSTPSATKRTLASLRTALVAYRGVKTGLLAKS